MMNEYMMLSIGAASAASFAVVMAVFAFVYAVSLIIEGRRRK